MAVSAKVDGLGKVQKLLKGLADKQGKAYERGAKKAALALLRDSMAIVPVQSGNLRASGFARVEGSGFDAVATAGYTANYAVYVHEDLSKAHGDVFNEKYKDKIADKSSDKSIWFKRKPEEQAKFLEKPLVENIEKYKDILIQEVAKAAKP